MPLRSSTPVASQESQRCIHQPVSDLRRSSAVQPASLSSRSLSRTSRISDVGDRQKVRNRNWGEASPEGGWGRRHEKRAISLGKIFPAKELHCAKNERHSYAAIAQAPAFQFGPEPEFVSPTATCGPRHAGFARGARFLVQSGRLRGSLDGVSRRSAELFTERAFSKELSPPWASVRSRWEREVNSF